ncbi:tRNA dihydrouridine synthase DusB [Mariprofundus erugo]|uniref:tRNA-dihydrouridine synthase n=1 Tax=Mariprofundus erugo TaxID=2528639 RepID=A0A5R9GRN4_9PROT|nr:tRNA dihydrouridine synthase DusB [Mariprofundus erugo]TLS67063.1 tRNA dihydrouridine synthase DusB [Mariprofundus erugo]TLS77239.1 tRNA dihydrouridine synthase DusB [Mariprofundus erugo]
MNNRLLPGFRLGKYTIDDPLVLAPMAGITDLPFRRICKRFGVGLMVTEMIASRAVDMGRERTERMAELGADEHPVSIQIAGSDPAFVTEAARWAVGHGADFVDINMGCPVKKICKQIAGSAMLKDPPLVARVLEAVVAAVDVPVTLKIRTGWDEQNKNVEQIARIAEESGIQLLTVHGRTRAQMFHGHANWEDIGRAKAAVSIPVIGNGDIIDAASAREMIRISGCDGIMVGRAVQGNPWVLGEVHAAIMGLPLPPPPTATERWAIVDEHLQQMAAHHGIRTASKLARKHVIWYSKGLHGSAEFRQSFQTLNDWQQMLDVARHYFLSPELQLHHERPLHA